MNNDDYSFLSLIFRQKYIKRWALMKNTSDDTLSSHSSEVAFIAHCLATISKEIYHSDINPDCVAVFALFHDVSEVITGDLPTPVKYFNNDMKNAYTGIEENAKQMLISKIPTELRMAYEPYIYERCDGKTRLFVKCADKLCALIKCAEEIKSGNNEFKSAYDSTANQLKDYSCLELDYFMQYLYPPFLSTLDENTK